MGENNKSECGKSSILAKYKNGKDGYIAFPSRCQDASCPECSQMITEYLKEQIAFWTVKKDLGTFLTLTTNEFNLSTLNSNFKTLQDLLKMMSNEDYFYKRKEVHGVKEKTYDEWINEIYRLEWFYIWTFGKQYSKKERAEIKGAVPYTSVALEINSLLHQKPSYIKKRIERIVQFKTGKKGKWLGKGIEDYYKNHIEKPKKSWSKITFSDIQNRQDYYKDIYVFHWDWIRYEFSKIPPVNYRNRIKKIDKLSFIRVLEYQKKGRPHYHILLNQYVPHALVKKAVGKKVYDIEDLEKDDGSSQTKDKRAASYLSKYFTKETVQMMKSEENKEKLVSTSRDISIAIEEAFKSDVKEFEIVKIKKGILPQNGMKFLNQSDFDKALLETVPTEHPNPYIQEIKGFLQSYLIKRQEINDKFARNEKFLAKQELNKLKEKRLFEVYKRDIQAFKYELERREGVKFKPLKLLEGKTFEGLSKEQIKAIKGILQGDELISFLIGYAGCGKTFTLTRLLDLIDTKINKVAVVSLTGKAVSRVKETINAQKKEIENIEISTIHRLAGAGLSDIPYPNFHSNAFNQLDYDIVIIDEYSMLSLDVLNNFLSAIPVTTKLIFVGDAGQLNPVNSFNPYYYFNKFTDFPFSTYELTHNFRSADVVNSIANSVRKGELDLLVFQEFDIENIVKRIQENPNLQVITNTNALAQSINEKVQTAKTRISINYKYDILDKVMFIKNDRKKKFFNGEFAQIKGFDETLDKVKLQIFGQAEPFEITLSQMNDCVVPGYAITCHKSQGSEFEEVIIVLDSEKTLLLSSNLLYTAITRAKQKFEIMTTTRISKKELDLLSAKQENEKLLEYEMFFEVKEEAAN